MNPFAANYHVFALFLLFSHDIAYAFDKIPEGISTWTEHGIVLESGAAGSWDEKAFLVRPMGFYKKDNIYYLYYLSGFEGCWNSDDDTNHQSEKFGKSKDRNKKNSLILHHIC